MKPSVSRFRSSLKDRPTLLRQVTASTSDPELQALQIRSHEIDSKVVSARLRRIWMYIPGHHHGIFSPTSKSVSSRKSRPPGHPEMDWRGSRGSQRRRLSGDLVMQESELETSTRCLCHTTNSNSNIYETFVPLLRGSGLGNPFLKFVHRIFCSRVKRFAQKALRVREENRPQFSR